VTQPETLNVGSRWSVRMALWLSSALVILTGGLFLARHWSADGPVHLTIAGGPPGGTYQALGSALAELLEERDLVGDARALRTAGALSNLEHLESDAQLALVQGDLPLPEHLRLVAPLYVEALHILVRADLAAEITSIDDLAGRRVALGPIGSGTRSVAARVLALFGVTPAEGLPLDLAHLRQAFAERRVDVAFALISLPTSSAVRELCEQDGASLLSLGRPGEEGSEADALALAVPGLRPIVLPRRVYGATPTEAVVTVGVDALLVARQDLDPELVQGLTRALFEDRARLASLGRAADPASPLPAIARRLREDFEPLGRPLHPGARAYYERDEPAFLVRYAEVISLALTLLVGVISLLISAREYVRRAKKNRIDSYYRRVEALAERAPDLPPGELAALRAQLIELRRDAFGDLIAERLEANASFTIFQDFLGSQLDELDARRSGA
jgi:uncharacterized protein